MGESGCTVGIEHIKELNDQAIKNVNKDSPELLKSERVMLIREDGYLEHSNITLITY